MKVLPFLINQNNYLIGLKIANQTTLFQSSPLRLGRFNKIVQIADPFIFQKNNEVFCFYEEYRNKKKGTILGLRTTDLKNWNSFMVELNIDCHISFPFIIQDNNNVYMIPETSELGEVNLYQSEIFPVQWKKCSTILTGNFVDSHIYVYEGIYFLFTTRKVKIPGSNSYDYHLELYYSDNIDSDYVRHPHSPIAIGRKYGRSAGSLFKQDGKLMRPVQDCDKRYGDDVHLFEIMELTKESYKDKLLLSNYMRNFLKLKNGGHHLSTINFKGEQIWAYDYNFKESYFQRFINKLKI